MIKKSMIKKLAKEILADSDLPNIEPGVLHHNDLPVTTSPWRYLAESLGLGVLDLNNLANILGFEDFKDLEIKVQPSVLYADKATRATFVKALKELSPQASDMRDDILISVIEEV